MNLPDYPWSSCEHYEHDADECPELDGPQDDDWISVAYERQAESAPVYEYQGGRRVRL